MPRKFAMIAFTAMCTGICGCKATAPADTAPVDSATFDPDGTAHITRIVPMPTTVSPEAQQYLTGLTKKSTAAQTMEERRARTDEWRKKQSAEAKRVFPVNIEESTTAGIRTDIITPLDMPEANKKLVLINLHGGGFNSDSGSLIEGDPICNLTKIKVVSVYYRLAPENPFPAAVDDVVAVYKELLKTYKSRNIGIFGTSAGATLTAEVAVKLKQGALALPGALGLFSVHSDYSRPTDSQNLFSLDGLPGRMQPRDPKKPSDDPYAGATNRQDPVLSPIFADWRGMSPTLLVTSTRDLLLSDTSRLHLTLRKAGVDSQLLVYEALPHAFWYHFELPETREALDAMASFFALELSH
jgi:monoterpene epsilon-lactone hydrolase